MKAIREMPILAHIIGLLLGIAIGAIVWSRRGYKRGVRDEEQRTLLAQSEAAGERNEAAKWRKEAAKWQTLYEVEVADPEVLERMFSR